MEHWPKMGWFEQVCSKSADNLFICTNCRFWLAIVYFCNLSICYSCILFVPAIYCKSGVNWGPILNKHNKQRNPKRKTSFNHHIFRQNKLNHGHTTEHLMVSSFAIKKEKRFPSNRLPNLKAEVFSVVGYL